MLPPETTPEWTEQDERELQRNAALSDPWCLDQSMVFFIRRYAREVIRLRSEREAQDAEIAKLKEDARRLDWMESLGYVRAGRELVESFAWERTAKNGAGGWAHCAYPIREAIDAAGRADLESLIDKQTAARSRSGEETRTALNAELLPCPFCGGKPESRCIGGAAPTVPETSNGC
jgi:hypothetical protein